jgi:uncharacterized OB-fold protein
MMEPKYGTPLSSADFESGKVISRSYEPRLEYAWDAGRAIGRYLEELKNGRLVGRRCRKCDRTFIPPRDFCELCFRLADEWVTLEDTGTVNTFSICYVTWDMKKLTYPQIPAVIEVDGASEGYGILHLIADVDPDEVRVGMKVKAVWKPAGEREGAITDIKHWAPVK